MQLDGLVNWLRVILAGILIHVTRYAWRGVEVLTRRRLPATQHYLVMRVFRRFFRSYPVTIAYPNPIMPRRMMRLALDLCENSQQWYFRLRGRYESEHMQFIARALQDAQVFIDVGANVGVFAITVAQAHPSLRAIAVEPLPANYSKLCHNILLNKLRNIRAIHAAVTPKAGEVTFYVNPIHDGGGSVIAPDAYRTGDVALAVDKYLRTHPDFADRVVVPSVSLDALVPGPAVAKIDVEGGEVGVLQSGLEALRRRNLRALVIEVRATTATTVVNLLQEQAYKCFMLDREGRCQAIDPARGLRLMNVVALPADSPQLP